MVGKILDQVRAVMSLLNERDQSQMVRITATVSPEPIPVTVSKFGGVPYLQKVWMRPPMPMVTRWV